MAQRDKESYDHHLSNVVGQCCKQWIVLKTTTLLGDQFLMLPRRCKSNYCPNCRAENLRRLRKSLFQTMKRDKWRLCTLTWPDHNKNVESAIHDSYMMFKRLTRQLRKIRPGFKYIRSIEVHKSGFIHIHSVFNKYIPISEISAKWKEVGGGIVDVRATKKCKYCHKPTPCIHTNEKRKLSYKDAARYLTQEMEKKGQDPHQLGFLLWKNRVRTVATSRNVQLDSNKGAFTYVGTYNSATDAYWIYEMLQNDAYDGKSPSPTIGLGKSSIFIGPGGHYKDDDKAFEINKAPKSFQLLRSIDAARGSEIHTHRHEAINDNPF
jgi:hypothetical protein